MGDLIARFILGGLVVTAFAVIGALVKPKSFAGVFGGAPSVALGTLGLAYAKQGGKYVAVEGRSMIAGAVALVVYSLIVGWLVLKLRDRPLLVTPLSWVAWLAVAFGLWRIFLA